MRLVARISMIPILRKLKKPPVVMMAIMIRMRLSLSRPNDVENLLQFKSGKKTRRRAVEAFFHLTQ